MTDIENRTEELESRQPAPEPSLHNWARRAEHLDTIQRGRELVRTFDAQTLGADDGAELLCMMRDWIQEVVGDE